MRNTDKQNRHCEERATKQSLRLLHPSLCSGFAMATRQSFVLLLIMGIVCNPLYAMDFSAPTRDKIIEMTLNSAGRTEQPKELEPIRIRVERILEGDDYALARALYLYNQRRLITAQDDLKEVLLEDPRNPAALTYLTNIASKIEAVNPPKETLEEGLKGIQSVEQAQSGGINGVEEFGGTDGEPRFTTNTSYISSKTNQLGSDWSNHFVGEAMKMQGTISDYEYTATASVNYYNKDDIREDTRLRNATWWMKNEKVQFILGDASSSLNRYILNGVNYRGVNVKMNLYENTFGDIRDKMTILYGKIPSFLETEERYIYPREISGIRNELTLWNWWDLNTSFAYIWDNDSRITQLNTNNEAKENALFGIDQVIRARPGVWTLYHASAFSYADDDRQTDGKPLRSTAHYFNSDIKTKKLKIFNSYEWVDPNFRSFVGVSGYTANRQVTINREHILNLLSYEPYEEVDFNLQYSRTRTNLDKSYDTETIKEENYKTRLKIMPTNGLPRFSLSGSIWNSNSTPGAINAPKDQSSWDTVFEMAKTVGGVDLSTSYGLRGYSQFINESNSYGDALEHSFTLSAHKKLYDKIDFTPSYKLARARLKKKPNSPIESEKVISHTFDLNVSSPLWDTAYLTFDYNLSSMEDFATSSVWGTNNAFTTTFSWPFTTNLGLRKKLVFSPYLSYHYSSGTSTFLDRSYFACRLDGDYFLTENAKLNLSGEYRENVVSDPTYVGFGDECRLILSYKTVGGF